MARGIAGLTLLAALAACNTAPGADSVGGKILRGTAEPASGMDVASIMARTDCPKVEIRNGTQTMSVYERGMDGDPQGVRYQASIQKTARECFYSGGILTMKVGVAGRLLAGPKGIGGSVTAPLRIAVVKAGDEGQVLYSQVHPIAANFSSAAPGVDFSKVDEGINVPAPGEGVSYKVYVGFDEKPAR
ncbi:MAG: hypothetical protein R3D02_16090 [Hyphomicrobiales bacterium]